jgi:hypothetical protein
MKRTSLLSILFCSLLFSTRSDQVPVRYPEGMTHGFLALKTPDGKLIADGQSVETLEEGKMTNRLTFRFKDGSIYEETAVFTQHGTFRLLSDRVSQNGPSFKMPLESSIDMSTGEVQVHCQNKGEPKDITKKFDLPNDTANGLLFALVKDIRTTAPTELSYVAFTPKPMLVKIVITSQGKQKFLTGDTSREAVNFAVKTKIGGLTGVLARAFRKVPPDTHIWVIGGDAPSFVALEGPLYAGGPIWRVELVSPVESGTLPSSELLYRKGL